MSEYFLVMRVTPNGLKRERRGAERGREAKKLSVLRASLQGWDPEL